MFQLLFPLHFSFPALVTCCAGLPSQEFDGQALEGVSHFYGVGGSDNAEKVQSTTRRCFWHSFLWQTLPKLLLHCLPRADGRFKGGGWQRTLWLCSPGRAVLLCLGACLWAVLRAVLSLCQGESSLVQQCFRRWVPLTKVMFSFVPQGQHFASVV